MNNEIESRTSDVAVPDIEEKTYRVESTGATISSGSSIPLLYRYCSKLPHDEYGLILFFFILFIFLSSLIYVGELDIAF